MKIALYGGARGKRNEVRGYALVDEDDFMWLRRFNWHLNAQGYAARRRRLGEENEREIVLMHREILGLEKGDSRQVDHRNRDKLDNRRENLRILAPWQQGHNMLRQGNFSSQHRGVSWDKKTGKWIAYVHVQGTKHVAGYFTDEQEAARWARKLRRKLLSHALD